MHSIERYGIVALLFLVVTVVAVLMWDGGKGEKKEKELAGAAVAPLAASVTAPAVALTRHDEPAGARRLNLSAESRPGPLLRKSGAALESATGVEPAEQRLGSEPAGTQAGGPPSGDARPTGLEPPREPQTPREEPVRDPVVGQAQAAALRAYSVRAGDTLSEIAQRELGSARRWPEILAANPGLDPTRLRLGKTIQIPGARAAVGAPRTAETSTEKAAVKPASTASPTWKVRQGENLWKIAQRALGDGQRWREIAALNPRVDPGKLVLGQVLTLPGPPRSSSTKVASVSPQAKVEAPLLASHAGPERPARRGGRVR